MNAHNNKNEPPQPATSLSELREQHLELARRVAILTWDLGGLAYEMAIRDHYRLDVLTRKAADLQELEAELSETQRLLAAAEDGIHGTCRSCGAVHSSGASYCWRCGAPFLEEARPSGLPAEQQRPAQAPRSQSPAQTPRTQSPAQTPRPQAPAQTPKPQAPAQILRPQAPAQTPRTQAPAQTPRPQAPAQTPRTQVPVPRPQSPAPTPRLQAPAQTPRTQAPAQAPRTQAPVQTPRPRPPATGATS